MPKIKTHSGTKKRVKLSKSGKVFRRHAGGGHFLQKKSASAKRGLAGNEEVTGRKSQKNLKRKLGA